MPVPNGWIDHRAAAAEARLSQLPPYQRQTARNGWSRSAMLSLATPIPSDARPGPEAAVQEVEMAVATVWDHREVADAASKVVVRRVAVEQTVRRRR